MAQYGARYTRVWLLTLPLTASIFSLTKWGYERPTLEVADRFRGHFPKWLVYTLISQELCKVLYISICLRIVHNWCTAPCNIFLSFLHVPVSIRYKPVTQFKVQKIHQRIPGKFSLFFPWGPGIQFPSLKHPIWLAMGFPSTAACKLSPELNIAHSGFKQLTTKCPTIIHDSRRSTTRLTCFS